MMFHGKQFNAPPACSCGSEWAAQRFLQVRLQWVYVEAEGDKMRRQALCAWRRETEGGAS